MGKKRDYTRFSRETVENIPADAGAFKAIPVDMTLNEAVEKLDEPVVGVVTDCVRLNIRENPTSDSPVVSVIDASTELVIICEESTNDFFKICTASGIEGYCMKKFITIMP